MDEEERGRIVSRRAFLKNVGGGAVGAAIVSGGLLPAQRVDAQSNVVPETFQIGAKV